MFYCKNSNVQQHCDMQVTEKETREKLPLKAQIVKPAQRIPRYELLVKVGLNFCFTAFNYYVMKDK